MMILLPHRLLCCLVSLLPALSLALEADRNEPIHIEADNAVVDEIKGTSIYRGAVRISQGTMLIEADEVEIHVENEAVTRIIATVPSDAETLAHYEQLPDDSDGPVLADARRITYSVAKEEIVLKGEASLQQLEDRFTGDLLEYDVTSGLLNLNSNPGERINITKYPRPTEAD